MQRTASARWHGGAQDGSGTLTTQSGTLKDVQAMIAVCRVGIAYFQEILGKYGRDTVLDATRVYMEQSERRTRASTVPGQNVLFLLARVRACICQESRKLRDRGVTCRLAGLRSHRGGTP